MDSSFSSPILPRIMKLLPNTFQRVAITDTASLLPSRSVSNAEMGEMLISGVQIDDEAAAEIVSKTRERSEFIERKTGLRARRFFPSEQSPVEVGLKLL